MATTLRPVPDLGGTRVLDVACGQGLATRALARIRSRVRHRHGPASLLACARGRWAIEHQRWLRDVVWHEDKSTIRTGHAPQVISARINLVITLFRLQGVTRITEETRRNAQNPSHRSSY